MATNTTTDPNEFMLRISRIATKAVPEALNDIKRKVAIDVFSQVVVATPIDTGRARSNWMTSVGAPISAERGTNNVQSALSEIKKVVASSPLEQDIYCSNNSPYITRLEFGGYGEGPKTAGGYSRQAPAGMVRVTIRRFNEYFREATRGARWQ